MAHTATTSKTRVPRGEVPATIASGGARLLDVGDRVQVHAARFPFALRPVTIVSAAPVGGGAEEYEVEFGLGGTVFVARSEIHPTGDAALRSGCRRCAAGLSVVPAA